MNSALKTVTWFAAVALSAFTMQAQAAPLPHPVVLELFTSQGCSSCPPADRLLAQLADEPGILALSWHITYWNRLGWRDPLSFEAATSRQQSYGVALGESRVYTPELIVQGKQDVVGSDASAVKNAISDAAQSLWIPVSLRRDGKKLHIHATSPVSLDADILLIGYVSHSRNKVPRGENAGTVAEHRNSVVSIQSLGKWNGKPLDLDADVPQGDGYAVLVQSDNYGPVIGGGWRQ